MKQNEEKETDRILIRITMAVYILLVLIFTVGADLAYAASDPLAVINNLSTFIFALIRAIGLILLGFGIVQIGLSLKSHDPSQRANGFSDPGRRRDHNICEGDTEPDHRIKNRQQQCCRVHKFFSGMRNIVELQGKIN